MVNTPKPSFSKILVILLRANLLLIPELVISTRDRYSVEIMKQPGFGERFGISGKICCVHIRNVPFIIICSGQYASAIASEHALDSKIIVSLISAPRIALICFHGNSSCSITFTE